MDPPQDQARIAVAAGKGYVLVEPPPGVDFWLILTTIGKLIPLEEFKENNDIWVFREGQVNLTASDLRVLKDFGANHHRGNGRKKTAIVVETRLQREIAESYINTGPGHPREIRVFDDFAEAEDWVASN